MYALITPAHNEGDFLVDLAVSVHHQTVQPERWVIVDDASTDDTREAADKIAGLLDFVTVIDAPAGDGGRLEGRDVIAFEAGVAALNLVPDYIVKLDADVTFDPDFFARLLQAFREDDRLGIASGTAWEDNGGWKPVPVTGDHVRGATRMYRRECWEQVSPLVQRLGWDTIDELKAQLAGWHTRSLDVPFYHHRPMGFRDWDHGASPSHSL